MGHGTPVNVFVSYSSADAPLAERLANDLRHHDVDVWLDQWALTVGTEFEDAIERGVDDADFVLVLLTPNSVESDWVAREWRRKEAVEREQGRIAVIPVRGEACEIPDFLRQRSYADISGGGYALGFRYLLDLIEHPSADGERTRPASARAAEADDAASASPLLLPVVTPIALEVAHDLIPLFEGEDSRAMNELVPALRAGIHRDLGVWIPGVRVRGNVTDMPPRTGLIMIEEVPVVLLTVPPDGNDDLFLIDALDEQVRTVVSSFIGPDEAHRMIHSAGDDVVALAHSIIPDQVSWFEFVDVLRRLVEEGISVADVERVLRTMSEHRPYEAEITALTEHVRHALKDQITRQLVDDEGRIAVVEVGSKIQATIEDSIQTTSAGSYLALEPEHTQAALSAIRSTISELTPDVAPALLASGPTRRYVRKLIELEFPDVPVISLADIEPSATIRVLTTIELQDGS